MPLKRGSMKILKQFPPNYELLKLTLDPPEHAIYCYRDIIYNPKDRTLTPDIELHESIHSKQQGDNPDIWWNRYLQDQDFRFKQELEAYVKQWQFIKESPLSQKAKRWGLEKMAVALSSDYKLNISYGEAESKIRNHHKNKTSQ